MGEVLVSDKEPERYYDWMICKMRQEDKKDMVDNPRTIRGGTSTVLITSKIVWVRLASHISVRETLKNIFTGSAIRTRLRTYAKRQCIFNGLSKHYMILKNYRQTN